MAFDLVRHQLRWGYSYDAMTHRNMLAGSDFMSGEEEDRWLETGPILANGRVIVTPRDSSEIHCLNLIDGSLIWKRVREQGLYVACVNDGAVIMVGRSQISALHSSMVLKSGANQLRFPSRAVVESEPIRVTCYHFPQVRSPQSI